MYPQQDYFSYKVKALQYIVTSELKLRERSTNKFEVNKYCRNMQDLNRHRAALYSTWPWNLLEAIRKRQ